ncbi:hypothetical protein G4B88_021466 [Cannabis sativa]|uniref:RNase H type-1 domain-containing protein n=1 Tax=Cannabis sativa TaxID=3483 RepID=A0A7J6DJ39_CANSA|nr:hypothetical protein G4B88_021466 [Cannabis sativa]
MFKLGGIDLEGVGAIFTWSNGQSWKRLIREKLDRVVVSAAWISYFKKAGVRNLASRNPRCPRIIEEAWNIAIVGFQSFMLCRRLHSTAKALSKWNREVFGHCQFKLQALERLLIEVQNRIPSKENVELEGSIMLEIDEVEKRLESIWKASPVANGIWATQEFIAENGVWIVGQNSSIDYWGQQWICGDGPILHKGLINPLTKTTTLVNDLVDLGSSGWNERMVENVFVPATALLINSLDRNFFPAFDVACWKSSNDGRFSLKAAYWDYNKMRFAEKDDTCGRIWLSKIHERFKVFLWKLCQDALPFGSKLLWFSSRWGLRLDVLSFLNGRELVAWLSHPPFQHLLNPQELSSFFLYGAVLYHKLWLCRNDAFHNGVPVDFKMLQKSIEKCFSEHDRIRNKESERPDSCRGVVELRWGLPRPGRVQGFVDFASDREVGAVAVVLYDALVRSWLMIEGVDFHTDNTMLVKGLIDRNSPSWHSHFSFVKLYDLLLSSDCSVSWISRVFNKAAHALARWGLSHSCNGLLRFWEVSTHVLTKLCVLAKIISVS